MSLFFVVCLAFSTVYPAFPTVHPSFTVVRLAFAAVHPMSQGTEGRVGLGLDWGVRQGDRIGDRTGVRWEVRLEGRTGGSDWESQGGRTGRFDGRLDWGVGRGRIGAFHIQKRIKHFSFINYIKILVNLVNFSKPLQSFWGDVNITTPFGTKRKKIYLKIKANQADSAPSPRLPHCSLSDPSSLTPPVPPLVRPPNPTPFLAASNHVLPSFRYI